MPPKGASAKEKRKQQRQAELAMKESTEECTQGEAILDKINMEKNIGISQYTKAVGHFTKAIDAIATNGQAYLLRAKCMKAMQDYDKAISDYSKAIELNPNDAEALLSRAYCYEQKQDWDAAIGDCTAAIEIQPNDDHAYNMRGTSRANKRPAGLRLKNVEYKQVIDDFTKAIEKNDCNYYAYANRGNVRCDRQEYLKAIEDYSRALYIKDDYWYVHSRRGVAYYEYVLAERSPKEDPDVVPAEKNAASEKQASLKDQWEDEFWNEECVLRNKEQFEAFLAQAILDFTIYIKHEEKEKGDSSTASLVYRAHTYLLQGNLDDALKDFKKAKELDASLEPLVKPQIDAIREQTGVNKALVHAD
eukprot:TRINITY_DN17239_c0_g1_i1.p1 TRINITY_DN17239_c0_g1~~TRINITY_DN17239_c0_g1_i1.p1  ORF type:complete len:382 (+),score=76.93 TRINITY_DN17239_c0_g1_i1:64-1146(+)